MSRILKTKIKSKKESKSHKKQPCCNDSDLKAAKENKGECCSENEACCGGGCCGEE